MLEKQAGRSFDQSHDGSACLPHQRIREGDAMAGKGGAIEAQAKEQSLAGMPEVAWETDLDEEYAPFPVECLPRTLRELAQAAGLAIECDPALVAVPALAVAAGCIGNAREIQLKAGWAEPSSVWAATVGGSVARKSPAFNVATRALFEIQMDRLDEAGDESAGCRFVTSDCTIPALAALMEAQPRGVLVVRDELDAWFASFTQFRGKGGGSDL